MNDNYYLIDVLQAAINSCVAEYEAEALELSNDAIIAVEMTIGEAQALIESLRQEGGGEG